MTHKIRAFRSDDGWYETRAGNMEDVFMARKIGLPTMMLESYTIVCMPPGLIKRYREEAKKHDCEIELDVEV